MLDLYAEIRTADRETQGMLADAMITRAADGALTTMRRQYFDWLGLPPGARVAEIGCGPGDITRDLKAATGAAEAIGIDPSPVMIERANQRHGDDPALGFVEGDGRDLPLADDSRDAVVFHTCLCHVPGPDGALAEARRILKPGGRLAVFDGDYATATAALGDRDPVGLAVDHAIVNLVHDRWLARSLPARIAAAGFETDRVDAHPYLAEGEAAYFMTLVERGLAFMARDGLISDPAADAVRAEAASRVAAGTFFGFISFLSILASRPAGDA